MPRVIHFEIHADDTKRAVKFYESAFGWQINNWGGPMEYWLATTGPDNEPGINGAIMPRMDQGTVYNTIGVPSLEEYMDKVKAAGGQVTSPKQTIPGVGYFAYCKDTEGNTFGIIQPDEAAK